MFLPTYYSTTIHLDLLATGFIISSNDKLQIYLLFIWSRRVVVETIFRKGKNLYVANECNNQRYIPFAVARVGLPGTHARDPDRALHTHRTRLGMSKASEMRVRRYGKQSLPSDE
jgi:hypothetical protein